MSRATVQCTRYWPSWRWCYHGVMWDCILHSVSENGHSQKRMWNKYCVSITSHVCFSKVGLCLFLLTLALLRDLSLGFQALLSRDSSLSLSVLFPGCLKFSTTSLLAAAFGTQMKLHSSFLIHWELVVWQCSEKVLALWQSSAWECWQVRPQYLHSSWYAETFNMIAAHCRS